MAIKAKRDVKTGKLSDFIWCPAINVDSPKTQLAKNSSFVNSILLSKLKLLNCRCEQSHVLYAQI